MRLTRHTFAVLTCTSCLLLPGVTAIAQEAGPAAAWAVRPEWVQSHEEFLASDVLAGRGSATRDEQIAATYVASEFMAYGLKTAPGMTGYIQAAELAAPRLDGQATLAAGSVSLAEGKDFQLLASTGASASGPLLKLTPADLKQAAQPNPAWKGAILLLAELPPGVSSTQAFGALRRSGAVAFLLPEDESTRAMSISAAGKTRLPIGLKGNPGRSFGTIVSLSPAAAAQLAAGPAGSAIITVHALPGTAPRQTFNAIGYLPGTDPAAGTILLTAHLDHLGTGRPVNGDAIYNGANDDAAGTTAVLELAHALGASGPLRRSVLFVCYGSEEIGELGSTYFGEHSPVPLKDLVANLEFEMIGNQDPKMPKGVLLLTGWDRSNLGQHGALLGPDPYPEQHFFERSDNYALALKGVVAHTAAGWGTPPTYHQPSDDIAHLDVPFMTAAIQSLIEPVRWLATSDFKPHWNPGGQPTGR